MSYLSVVFRRGETSKDGTVQYVAYWPDGEKATTGVDSFCRYGRRFLKLDGDCHGRELWLVPLSSREERVEREAGWRSKRFGFVVDGTKVSLLLVDYSPTLIVFDLVSDDPRIVRWLQLPPSAAEWPCWAEIRWREASFL